MSERYGKGSKHSSKETHGEKRAGVAERTALAHEEGSGELAEAASRLYSGAKSNRGGGDPALKSR